MNVLSLKQVKPQLHLIFILLIVNVGLLCFYSQTLYKDKGSREKIHIKTHFESTMEKWENHTFIKGHTQSDIIKEQELRLQNNRKYINNDLYDYVVDRTIHEHQQKVGKEKSAKKSLTIKQKQTLPKKSSNKHKQTTFIIYTRCFC